jgi:hypothetical protein
MGPIRRGGGGEIGFGLELVLKSVSGAEAPEFFANGFVRAFVVLRTSENLGG